MWSQIEVDVDRLWKYNKSIRLKEGSRPSSERGKCFEEILFIATHAPRSHIIGEFVSGTEAKQEEIASFGAITTIFTATDD